MPWFPRQKACWSAPGRQQWHRPDSRPVISTLTYSPGTQDLLVTFLTLPTSCFLCPIALHEHKRVVWDRSRPGACHFGRHCRHHAYRAEGSIQNSQWSLAEVPAGFFFTPFSWCAAMLYALQCMRFTIDESCFDTGVANPAHTRRALDIPTCFRTALAKLQLGQLLPRREVDQSSAVSHDKKGE